MTPLVTVLVDTWNHERFIEKAIDSVLAQEFDMSTVEIIVVDDGSTDGTPRKIAAFGDRVRYVRKENGGQASAFNTGIPLARGEYIAMLDGDDWWRSDKLSKVIGLMRSRPDVGFVGHAIIETDGEGTEKLIDPGRDVEFRLNDREGAELMVKHRAFMGTSRMAGRAEVFHRLLPVPEDLIVEADEHFFTLAPAITTAVVLRDPLCYYRLHGGNLYQFTSFDDRRLTLKCKVHACLAKTIPAKLEELNVPEPAKRTVLDTVFVDARRLELATLGGGPGSALGVEWKILRQQMKEGTATMSPVKWLMLVLALVLPARAFYRMRAKWTKVQRSTGQP